MASKENPRRCKKVCDMLIGSRVEAVEARPDVTDRHAPQPGYGTACGISFKDEILKQPRGGIMTVETIEIFTEPVEIPQKIPIVADAYYTR